MEQTCAYSRQKASQPIYFEASWSVCAVHETRGVQASYVRQPEASEPRQFRFLRFDDALQYGTWGLWRKAYGQRPDSCS
ncbi:hypothetical protein AYI69_g3150 [Smittium culicis]|uniref:Uncharacterized protein n=1 Tax=Smittium culicis TaxID=133412 RepID=A0A1R1YKI8_9FUNG|nr:hypothetical protein AYI69_g3150 [Smittium culicis]